MTAEPETSDLPAAAIGHNSIPAGEMVEADPAVVYREKGVLEALLAEIDASIAEHPNDLNSDRGRKAIASLAASIARKKGPIVEAGLGLTEGWRKSTAAVNAIKKFVEAEFDKRRDLARKPLDEWEAKDKERRDRIAGVIERLDALANIPPGATVENIDEALATLKAIDITDDAFGEFAARAQASWRKAHTILTDARAADQEHRSNIMREAKEAIIEHGGIGEDRAKKIVLAIVAGSIPHTAIKF